MGVVTFELLQEDIDGGGIDGAAHGQGQAFLRSDDSDTRRVATSYIE